MADPLVDGGSALYQTNAGVIPTNSGTPKQVLGSDPNRLVLIVTNSTTGTIDLFLGPTDGTGLHFCVNNGVPFTITYREHGDIVQLPLWTGMQFGSGVASWMTLRKI